MVSSDVAKSRKPGGDNNMTVKLNSSTAGTVAMQETNVEPTDVILLTREEKLNAPPQDDPSSHHESEV